MPGPSELARMEAEDERVLFDQMKAAVTEDPTNPRHYRRGAVECIDAIHAALGDYPFSAYLRGQIMKYAWRFPYKGPARVDAGKLAWYANRLERLTQESDVFNPRKLSSACSTDTEHPPNTV